MQLLKKKTLSTESTPMICYIPQVITVVVLALSLSTSALLAQGDKAASRSDALPPKTWIDADTGHRVTRLTDEPNSKGLYFNINAFTADKRDMVYTSPTAIRLLNLQSFQSRSIYEGKVNRSSARYNVA